ncbi:MAG: gfo/Idh/MocA family oxidoreductase [Acidobacteria bacterium]|nr:MAG: gfo/Idh/MocA family oxidoreductase [Acidobacteriota bacterium]
MKNFAMTGVSGFVAPRHLKAIHDTGHRLVAAVDPHDAVGLLDQYSFDVRFFTEIERFDRHLEKLRRGPEAERVDFLSICSPNYLHDAHIRLALRAGADAICEKPLVINPWNLDALQEIEAETKRRVNTVLQLRCHPDLVALKARLDAEPAGHKHEVTLSYITARGRWYAVSLKGSDERSGGVVTNIGIHFFDLLIWLFGRVQLCEVNLRQPQRAAGYFELDRAAVRWFLSTDPFDLPPEAVAQGRKNYRSIQVDGADVEFSEGFVDLHTTVYQRILDGQGHGIEDARPSIALAHQIRHALVTTSPTSPHPRLLHVLS